MKKNLTSSPAADPIRSGQEMPPYNGEETAENAVSRAAERDEAPNPGNETETAPNAPKARKTRKTKDAGTTPKPETLTGKPVSDWTTEDGVQTIRDFMGILPERVVEAYLKAEAGASKSIHDLPPDITVSSKTVYLAVVRAYISDAVNNLRSADEDHDPKAAREIYSTEIAIGNLLLRHWDLTPAEMTDVLPNQTGAPMENRIPEINANRTLFFMDHLHRVLFRPEEPDPHDTGE